MLCLLMSFGGDKLVKCFKYIEENEDNIKSILNEKMPEYKEKASKLFKTVIDTLEKMPEEEHITYEFNNRKVYACKNKNEDIRLTSSSGGFFYELASYILKKQGSVFGVAYVDKEVKHIEVSDLKDLYKLQGSKYVESNMHGILGALKERLEAGKKVLFTGTPCQVASVYSFLKKDYDNLYTASLICHGVPAKKYYYDYVKELEKEENDELVEVKFRYKEKNNNHILLQYVLQKKSYVNLDSGDIYFKTFLNNLNLRDSCFDCKFKLYGNSKSDFILGDFWGVNEVVPDFDDGLGASAVITNSEKGNNIFEKIKDSFECKEVSIEDVLKDNPTLTDSVKLTLERYNFIDNCNKMDIISAMKFSLANIEIKKLEKKIQGLEHDVDYYSATLREEMAKASELENILSSKRFRLADKIGNMFNKLTYKIKKCNTNK